MTRYQYVCRLCGDVLEGEEKDGLMMAAKMHYSNQHGLQHETDVKPTGIEVDNQAIKERMQEVD